MTDWDERYRRGEHVTDEPHPLVVRFALGRPTGIALDVACGAGRHAVWLARMGWEVTAVDASRAGIEIVERRARERNLVINAVVADLERHEFEIEREAYDLIVVVNYLQRDLFPFIRAGVRPGGMVIAVIAMVDSDPNVKAMNPAYLLNPGQLRAEFAGWEILHDFEGKHGDHRATAEIVAVLL